MQGNKKAEQELGYGEALKGISVCKIFQKALTQNEEGIHVIEEEDKKLLAEGKSIETVAYRKNQTCFDVDLKIVIKNEDGFLACVVQLTPQNRLEQSKIW